MDDLRNNLQPYIDLLPDALRAWWWALALAAIAALGLVAWAVAERLILRPLFRRKTQRSSSEEHLRVDLSQLPPVSAADQSGRLLVEGVPVRARLVVLAPLGQGPQHALPDNLLDLLDRVLPGLGNVVRSDAAVVTCWPAQISRAGFGPKFHALVTAPEPSGGPSRWVLAAGPVRSAERQFSLGLALEANEPCYLGRLTVTPDRWPWLLRIRA